MSKLITESHFREVLGNLTAYNKVLVKRNKKLAARVNKLEPENARLRLMVKKLQLRVG